MDSMEKIKNLCKEYGGTTLHKLEMELNFGNAYFRNTKKISADKLYLVANYFGVPMESLLPDDLLEAYPAENKKAATETSDGDDKHAELISLFDDLSVEQQDRILAQLRDLAQLQRVLGILSK